MPWILFNLTVVKLTLTSINPRCSVLKPPMLASSSFISAVMWIFRAMDDNEKRKTTRNKMKLISTDQIHNNKTPQFLRVEFDWWKKGQSTLASWLHAAGCIHGITKKTVSWHLRADNAGNHRPSVRTASNLQSFGCSVLSGNKSEKKRTQKKN